MEGVFIPREIIYMNDLKSMAEKAMLAIYQYYTEQGKYKCCTLTKPQIADELNISVNTVKEFKKHLKDIGYIRTEGKNKVFYVGVQQGATAPIKPDNEQGATAPPLGATAPIKPDNEQGATAPPLGATAPPNQVLQHPITRCYSTPLHKKENKEEKRNKKEGMTKFDQIMSLLPVRHHTPEKEEYLKNKYGDKIDNINLDTPGTKDVVKINLTNELDDKFPPIFQPPVKEEEEQKIDYTNYDE